jgi:hypothetical protein
MLANSSLPTPDSPVNSTVACVGATRDSRWQADLKADDTPTICCSPGSASTAPPSTARRDSACAAVAPKASALRKPCALR